MCDIAKQVADLSPEKRALLMRRLQVSRPKEVHIAQTEQELIIGTVPLLPRQRWFFERNIPDPHQWNIVELLEVHQDLDPTLIEQITYHLLAHHDALRLRFVHEESVWRQFITGSDVASFTSINLSMLTETAQGAAIKAIGMELQSTLNLFDGPVARVALFDLGPYRPKRLLVIIHHLVSDGVSLRILLEDFWTAYQQLSHGKAIRLPPKTTSIKYYAERLTEHAQSEALQTEKAFWLSKSRGEVASLPMDYPENIELATIATSHHLLTYLSVEETWALVHRVPRICGAQVVEILLTALAQILVRWTGTHSMLIELTSHGRDIIFDDVDISRTIGWLTNHSQVFLELDEILGPKEALHTVTEQLRQMPNKGTGYDLLRHLSNDAVLVSQLRSFPESEVFFNYAGQQSQGIGSSKSSLFQSAGVSWELASPAYLQTRRPKLLVLWISINAGQLRIDWDYSKRIYRRSTIEYLATAFLDEIRLFIEGVASTVREF